ncbi:hypothetical protein MKEN_01010000 [Mycena kentingensis (nom. inval.)]|nr:hypothetical protein MKEN_01010000 [Mycena kentingensis (nom. inval.)]
MSPRPLPSTHLPKFSDNLWPQERQTTLTNTNTYVLRLPIGRVSPPVTCTGPRSPKSRRVASPASSTSSVISASFWEPLTDSEPDTPPTSDDESSDTPALALAAPIPFPRRTRTKPANIVIPSSQATTTSRPVSSALSPAFPLSPTIHRNSPDARIRKLAKLTRTLGENVPVELVFPSSANDTDAPAAYLLTSPTSPVRFSSDDRLDYEPPTPTPIRRSPGTTAVGLHHALGNGMQANRGVSKATPVVASPPPFTNVFTMDASSWDRARAAALAPVGEKKRSSRVSAGSSRNLITGLGRGARKRIPGAASGMWRTCTSCNAVFGACANCWLHKRTNS